MKNISTLYYITEDGKCYNNKTGKYLKGKINKDNGLLYYIIDGKKFYAQQLVKEVFGEEINKNKAVYCFNKDKELVAQYDGAEGAAAALNISLSLVEKELNKEIKSLCGGFYWSFDKTLGEIKDYKNLGKAKEIYQYDLKGKYINKYPSTGAAARSLGLSNSSHIGECARGKIKQYKGFVWRYSEDIVLPLVKAKD